MTMRSAGYARRALAALAAALVLGAAGAAPADGARALLDRVRTLNQTTRKWTDRVQRMQLTIVGRRGDEARRELEVMSKRYGDDASRSIMFFHAPPAVRGIGFLQWITPHEPDRQWLYLPALKRVRQISGGARSESFVGTDFSYEDLSIMADVLDWGDDRAAVRLIGEDTVDGHPSDVIELRPTPAAEVSYGVIRLWIGRDDQIVHKYEFADATGQVLKTLTLADVRQVGAIPTAYRYEMHNERGGSRTTVELTALQYDTGLDDDVFTQRRLEKGAS